jgi:hypothetical protein
MAVDYFGCYFVGSSLTTNNVMAITHDPTIPERRRYEIPFMSKSYTETDLLNDYTTQQLWNAGTEITDDYLWAMIQVIVRGVDIIAASEAQYDSWDTDTTAVKLETVHDLHDDFIKVLNLIYRIARATLKVVD